MTNPQLAPRGGGRMQQGSLLFPGMFFPAMLKLPFSSQPHFTDMAQQTEYIQLTIS